MSEKPRAKAYVYTRVSTAMQVDGFSLDAQRDEIRRFAELKKIDIVGEYCDEGKSGKNTKNRTEFNRMLADIKRKKDDVRYVLVFKLSRFARNAADTLENLRAMQNCGVDLLCTEDGMDSSSTSGKLIISIMSAFAEMELENIHTQTMAGRRQKAKEGKWNHESFVYVSGHTHRNVFYDDGAIRVYAENQIGYHNDNVHLRSFLLDGKYDYFTDYKDGIYEITKEEYQDFMHGKNITM